MYQKEATLLLKLCTYLQKFIFSPNYHFHNKTSRNMISAKDAILKVKEYAEQGYTFVVVLDLSKYFDTLNHEILINLLRKNVRLAVRLPCGSASISNTFFPCLASPIPRFTVVVIFPTPPFWFDIAITLHIIFLLFCCRFLRFPLI